MAFAACTSSPTSGASTAPLAAVSSTSGSSSSPATPSALTVNITIANGKVDRNGKKINVSVGEEVILQVTTDIDDEIHAHTADAGYELEVKADEPTTGTLT